MPTLRDEELTLAKGHDRLDGCDEEHHRDHDREDLYPIPTHVDHDGIHGDGFGRTHGDIPGSFDF